MDKIKVVDSIPGSGKTTWATNFMTENPHKRFLYICPYNEETKRIKNTDCPELGFELPSNEKSNKQKDVQLLITKNKNIASTHELFKRFNETTAQLKWTPLSRHPFSIC